MQEVPQEGLKQHMKPVDEISLHVLHSVQVYDSNKKLSILDQIDMQHVPSKQYNHYKMNDFYCASYSKIQNACLLNNKLNRIHT